MRTSGRSTVGSLAFVLFAAFAGVAAAAEIWTVDVPAGEAYLVTAVLVPGPGGADVLGDDKGDGHVDFRIGFGSDLQLSVNGTPAGAFDPQATYAVSIDCHRVAGQWFATTRVVNQGTGALVYAQMNFLMPGAAEEVRAVAQDVIQLDVH